MPKIDDIIDDFVLQMIKETAGVKIAESISRLYTTCQISNQELAASVEKGLISLADYNDILEGFYND